LSFPLFSLKGQKKSLTHSRTATCKAPTASIGISWSDRGGALDQAWFTRFTRGLCRKGRRPL